MDFDSTLIGKSCKMTVFESLLTTFNVGKKFFNVEGFTFLRVILAQGQLWIYNFICIVQILVYVLPKPEYEQQFFAAAQ